MTIEQQLEVAQAANIETYRFVADAGTDGTVHRALLRASVALLMWRGHVKAFAVAPGVWMQLMLETNYATVAGTQWKDNKPQLCTPGGYCDVIADPTVPSGMGQCTVGSAAASLDLGAVLG